MSFHDNFRSAHKGRGEKGGDEGKEGNRGAMKGRGVERNTAYHPLSCRVPPTIKRRSSTRGKSDLVREKKIAVSAGIDASLRATSISRTTRKYPILSFSYPSSIFLTPLFPSLSFSSPCRIKHHIKLLSWNTYKDAVSHSKVFYISYKCDLLRYLIYLFFRCHL